MRYTELDKYIKAIARPDRNESFSIHELRESLIDARETINSLTFELENAHRYKLEYIKKDIESLSRSMRKPHLVDEIAELERLLNDSEASE